MYINRQMTIQYLYCLYMYVYAHEKSNIDVCFKDSQFSCNAFTGNTNTYSMKLHES